MGRANPSRLSLIFRMSVDPFFKIGIHWELIEVSCHLAFLCSLLRNSFTWKFQLASRRCRSWYCQCKLGHRRISQTWDSPNSSSCWSFCRAILRWWCHGWHIQFKRFFYQECNTFNEAFNLCRGNFKSQQTAYNPLCYNEEEWWVNIALLICLLFKSTILTEDMFSIKSAPPGPVKDLQCYYKPFVCNWSEPEQTNGRIQYYLVQLTQYGVLIHNTTENVTRCKWAIHLNYGERYTVSVITVTYEMGPSASTQVNFIYSS